jgi:hypothetical protein
MNRIVFILLMLAGLVANAQVRVPPPVTAPYLRITGSDTTWFNDPVKITFPPSTGTFYYNRTTGYIMYKDAAGIHKLVAGGSGGGGGGGTIVGVNGTTNRITATGTTTRTLDISATFEALLGKVANPLSQFAATTSAQLAGVISNETGSGALVFGTSPTLTTPALGTPSALVLTNATGLPVGSVTGMGTGVGTWLVTPTGQNLGTALTNESGTGVPVFTISPALVTPALGTPSSVNLANATNLPMAGLAAATSSQLAGVLSDEVSTGPLYFGQPTGANTDVAGNYTLGTGNVGNNNTGIVRVTGAGPYTVTYPTNTTSAIPLKSLISVINQSSDTITVAFAGGVTHNDNGDYDIPPHGVGSFFKQATNTVDYFGSSAGGGGGISSCKMLVGEFTTAKTLTTDDIADCNAAGFWTYTGSADVNVSVPLFSVQPFEDGANIAINNQSAFTITIVLAGGISGGGHLYNTIPAGETGMLYFRDENVVDILGTRAPTEDLLATATLDFGSVVAGAIADLTVTVTGAVVGDIVALGAPAIPNKGTYFAWVSATNTVTVRFANNDLTTAKDPASGSFKVRVFK